MNVDVLMCLRIDVLILVQLNQLVIGEPAPSSCLSYLLLLLSCLRPLRCDAMSRRLRGLRRAVTVARTTLRHARTTHAVDI